MKIDPKLWIMEQRGVWKYPDVKRWKFSVLRWWAKQAVGFFAFSSQKIKGFGWNKTKSWVFQIYIFIYIFIIYFTHYTLVIFFPFPQLLDTSLLFTQLHILSWKRIFIADAFTRFRRWSSHVPENILQTWWGYICPFRHKDFLWD